MILKNITHYASNFCKQLDQEQFKRLLYSLIIIVIAIIATIHYVIYSISYSLEAKIRKNYSMAKNTEKVLQDFEHLRAEEERLTAILANQKDFHIQLYFEQLCKEKNLNNYLQAGSLDVSLEQLNDQIYEESLQISFKGLTAEVIVNLLEEIGKQEMLHIKELSIKSEKDKKVACDFTLATIKNK